MADMSVLRPGFWTTGRAWLDNDGRHVWVAHDCTTERVATMLPFPIWHSTGLAVEPSVSCDACGLHTHLGLGVPDDEYRCMETWEIDGRWCERPKDHPPNHSAGMVDWGTYVRVTTPDA